MLPVYNKSLINALGMLNDFFPSWLQPILEEAAIQALPHLGAYADEITAGANKLGIPLGTATLLNVVYEAAAACTSIIAQDSQGNIYHGRNLDWDLADTLRFIT
jgi:N-acylethanolamine-hydrolysing acid amidase